MIAKLLNKKGKKKKKSYKQPKKRNTVPSSEQE